MDNLGFFSDEEKQRHYAAKRGIDLNYYRYEKSMKIYQGADFLCYTFTREGDLKIHSSFMVTDLSVSAARGVIISWIDKRDYVSFQMDYYPDRMKGYNAIGHVPYKCMLERTLKVTPDDKLLTGFTANFVCRMKSEPTERVPGDTYIIPHRLASRYFREGEMSKALEE